MKRTVATLLITILLLAMVLTACSSPAPAPAAPAEAPAQQPASEAPPAEAPAEAPDDTVYTIKIGHSCADSHPYQLGALKFKELVEEASGGRLQVEIYPSTQLGNERDMIESLQAGTLEMTVASIGVAASFLEGADMFNLPFVFKNTEHFTEVAYGDLGQEFISHVDGKNGLKVMSIGYPVFRIPFSNSGPWVTMDDFKGMKIRTQEVNAHMDAYAAIGAAPTPMASSEQHVAYQTGMLNGGENSIVTIHSEKYYESCPDITELTVICGGAIWMMSQSFYDGLPADLQQIIDDNIEGFSRYCDEQALADEASLRSEIEAEGGVFHQMAPEEVAKIQAAAAPVIDKYQAELPDWAAAMLQKIRTME